LRRLAEHALSLYETEPVSLSPLTHFHNTTFVVTQPNSSRYVLRIHRGDESPLDAPQRRTRVESELWWLDRLRADLDLSVPTAVRTPGGEGVVRVAVEGVPQARLCVLFHWMDGRFLHRRLMPAHLEQVSRLTARLHEHSRQLTVPAFFHRQRVDRTDGETEEYVVRLFADHWSVEAVGVMRAMFQRARRVQEELGSGSDTFGLIHADIHQKNYLFSDGTLRLIDFDDCGWGHYLYDLAVTINEVDYLPRGAALREALLAGYRQVRELSPAHLAMIETFIMLRKLQDITWFLQERDNPSFGTRATRIGDGVTLLKQFLDRGG
jgi:Ser/Thr protein kinase RdoA (MazF antagonist)